MTIGVGSYNDAYQYDMRKNAGLGLASFALALTIGVYDILLIVFASIVETGTPGAMDEDSVIAIVVGLLILAGLASNMLGIALGIGGLFQNDRKKVFSVLGTTFNSAIILGIIGLMVLGAVAG
jgi:hypothetical protein